MTSEPVPHFSEHLEQGEIPTPADRVIMIDLDGTLIDGSYQVTDDRIFTAIANAQAEGWQVGLSSDTPFAALDLWAERFGMEGPIIAERGAVVETEPGLLQYDQEVAAAFEETTARLEVALADEGIEVWKGNPVEAFRDGIRFGQPGEPVVFLNDLRRCSLGIFARINDLEGNLLMDPRVTNMVADIARTAYSARLPEIEEDLNHDYGLLITTRVGTDKRVGSRLLMATTGIRQFAMIGNSGADFVGEDLALHYAVADATPELRDRADYVASQPLTAGVVEILQRLTATGGPEATVEDQGV